MTAFEAPSLDNGSTVTGAVTMPKPVPALSSAIFGLVGTLHFRTFCLFGSPKSMGDSKRWRGANPTIPSGW